MENRKQDSNGIINNLWVFLRRLKFVLRKIKSFLIFALVALAIYQTGQLWFANLSNHNFFLRLSARFTPSVPDGYREFVRPMRWIYGAGDGRFTIGYSGLMEIPPRVYFDTVLTELFAGRFTFAGEREADFTQLLSRPVLIYEYAFPMPGDVFHHGFNRRTGVSLTGLGITGFTSVAIWPPYANNRQLSVFFIYDDRIWEFTVDSAAGDVFNFPVHPVSAEQLYFVSAALEGYVHLPPNTFVARTGERGFAAHPVRVSNPYLTHVGLSLQFIRSQVVRFFDNPATINSRIGSDGIWTFSNIHTTVRYVYTHVLEYHSFRPRRHNVNTSFMEDFSAALAFIEADHHVINEIFLTGFEPRGAGYVFWFGYIVNHFPILMPEGWVVSSPEDILPAPIEVVVEQGRVVLYRRLPHNFQVGERHVWRVFDLDEFLKGQEGTVDGLTLGYLMRPHGNLLLDWWACISENEAPEGYDATENEESDT